MSTLARGRAVRLIALLVFGFPLFGQGQEPRLSDTALQQIEALEREKESRTPAEKKIDSQLLYKSRMRKGLPAAPGIPTLDTSVVVDADGFVVVDLDLFGKQQQLLDKIANAGGEVLYLSVNFNALRARLPIDSLRDIATDASVRFISPAAQLQLDRDQTAIPQRLRPMIQSVNTSQGVKVHRADVAATTYGATGAGIKIGVISDSVDYLPVSRVNGDIGNVTILSGRSGVPGTGEGSAMLEIVHDMAPDADLYFATANGGVTAFADSIIALRDAGCDIIVDDVSYSNESPFQDGPIAQAVNTVTAGGVLYFSSAGNAGSVAKATAGVYEGNFADSGTTLPGISTGPINQFNNGTTNGNSNQVTAASSRPATLFWTDPLGGSTNDYDLFVFDSGLTSIVSSSTNVQSGTQDPFEQTSNIPATNTRLVVVKKTAAQARFLHLNTNRGRLSIATFGQTRGHSAAANAFSVAAAPAATAFGSSPNPAGPFPNPFTGVNLLELFSSDGPRKVFFNANGTLANGGNPSLLADGGITRQKPDITAADGVSTSVTGFSSFFGTSAAAPHAAAIAALVKSVKPAATATEVRNALVSSAIDIETPGTDKNSGAGIVMADSAIVAIGASAQPVVHLGNVAVSEGFGNGNGTLESGEDFQLFVTLKNDGPVSATGISATLSTSSPEVTLNNATSVYPAIGATLSLANTTAFTGSVSPSAVCGTVLHFTLTVTYAQSTVARTLSFNVVSGASAGAATFTYAGSPVAIPDGGNGTPGAAANASLVVNGVTGGIANLVFRFNGTSCNTTNGSTTVGLDHSYVGDLVVTLTSPHGTTVTLIDRLGAGNNQGLNFCNTVLSDAGVSSIQGQATAANPFTGTFAPNSPLAAFNGEDPNGTWTLTARDFFTGDTGSVRAFSLVITPSACAFVCPHISVTQASMPAAIYSAPYNATLAASGSAGPHSFAVTVGSLPTGINIVPTGSLSGSTTVAPGSYPVTITATDSVTSCAGSSALSFVVSKASTTTAVQSSVNPSTFGQQVNFTATVSPVAPAVATPAGQVVFTVDGVASPGVTLVNGTATLSTSSLSVAGSPHSILVSYAGDTNFNSSTSVTLFQTVNSAPLAAPVNLVATATSTTQVALSWSPVANATGYDVYRSSLNAPFAFAFSTAATNTSDSGLTPNTSYLYKVLATGPGGPSAFSAMDPATTVIFTDPNLVTGNVIRHEHMEELRTAVNALRAAGGLGAFVFTDPTITASATTLKPAHMTELRTALNGARLALALSAPGYADATINSGTPVRAQQITEIRNGVK